MAVQLTIIGLGRIGSSAGLALAAHTDQLIRMGHDIKHLIAKKAQKLGAVDKIHINLPASVENADIILLALPVDQVYDTLKVIAPDLKENVVVMDTCPCKAVVAGWVKDFFPPNRHYVGLVPVINPAYLNDVDHGIDSAKADLFQRGVMAIAAPQGTNGAAIKLAADLSSLLGAAPLFADMAELDGFLAATHILPQLTAAALTNAIIDPSGWADRRKITGHQFATATALGNAETPAALSDAARLNKENTIIALNHLIEELAAFRDDLGKEQASILKERLTQAGNNQSKWLQERNSGDWRSVESGKTEYPKVGDIWKQFIGDPGKLFGQRRKEKKE